MKNDLIDMRKLVSLCIILFSFIITSCKNETKNNVKEIFIDFSNVENLDLSKAEKVNLELTENSIIGRVDEFLLYDDKYYFILSGSNLFVFDHNGSFLNQIGSKGT